MFFGFFLFITLYRHIVAVKVTIDKQSPHAKLLCLNISNEVERYKVTAEITSATPRRMKNNFCDPKTND